MNQKFEIQAFLFLITLLLLLIPGCSNKPGVVNIQMNWKSDDPQTIPLPVREREYQRGNLINNPSFESGRFFAVDSTRKSYSINGWNRLGENVFWTDIREEGIYERDEASDGFHAIKILREKADETDIQGEGIITDFIKVIPGNYQLTCDIRLLNIESGLKRLSTNLIDAVNIRLFFYDRNKILIRSSVYNPAGDNTIDNSFKAYSFSGFEHIKELGWSRINCISNHFPFEEGDIPSDARFVKVFLGLKGTGTMWVDLVDFRYTSANFSLLEKCESFYNQSYKPSEMLVPSPVSISGYHNIELIQETEEDPLYPVILVPHNYSEEDLRALLPMRKALEEIIPLKDRIRRGEISVVNKLDPGTIESGRLIFSIGNTPVFKDNAEHLPLDKLKGESQGYLIHRLEPLNNLVFIYAENPEGYYYASGSIKQLTDIVNGIYHHFNILDFPAFKTRSFIAKTVDEMTLLPEKEILDLFSFRLNNMYLSLSGEDISFRSLPGLYLRHKQHLSSIYNTQPYFRYGFSGIDMMYSENNTEKSGKQQNSKFIEESTKAFSEILNRIDNDEESGILLSDRSLWDFFRLGSPSVSSRMLDIEDYKQFIEINGDFFNTLHKLAKKPSAISHIYFLPVFNDNALLHKSGIYGKHYFKDFYLNDNEPEILLWQGPAEYSFSIDGAEMARFQLETMKSLVWFDNTLTISKKSRTGKISTSLYPGKARLSSFFEPFQVDMKLDPNSFYNGECIINLPDFSAISQIRLATAADFLWNNEDYNPDFSIWKVLVNRYGKEGALELIRFNDTCHKLLYISMLAEIEGLSQKLSRDGEDVIQNLNREWESITMLLASDVSLLNQLTDKKNQIITRYYQTIRKRGRALEGRN